MRRFTAASLLGFSLLLPATCFADVTVGQEDKQFSVDAVTVTAGESVRFANNDTVVHNLTIKQPDGSILPSLVQAPGEERVIAFSKPGEHMVRCLIHPKMKMTVHVH